MVCINCFDVTRSVEAVKEKKGEKRGSGQAGAPEVVSLGQVPATWPGTWPGGAGGLTPVSPSTLRRRAEVPGQLATGSGVSTAVLSGRSPDPASATGHPAGEVPWMLGRGLCPG